MKITSLSLSKPLIEALDRLNIEQLFPIQELVLPAALAGDDLLVKSQTGSGKTLAYLLPLLEKILSRGEKKSAVRALILSPTRELAQQIELVCSRLCEDFDVHSAVIVGGVEYAKQREELSKSPQIIVATPGRLLDLMEHEMIQLRDVEYFILDEVDQMLDLGFRDSIMSLSQLRSASSQSLFFSATVSDEVSIIVGELSHSVKRLSLADEPLAVEKIDHFGYYVSFEMMDRLLIHLLRGEEFTQAIVFTRSRKMADRVVGLLSQNAIVAEAMHSDRSQAAREHIIARFRSGETRIIVATDVIARGIDIDSVSHVFNFGLPQNAEQYIHRVGRCGRAGRAGKAISLFTPEEKTMVDAICRLMKRHIDIDNTHPYMTPEVTRALSGGGKKR